MTAKMLGLFVLATFLQMSTARPTLNSPCGPAEGNSLFDLFSAWRPVRRSTKETVNRIVTNMHEAMDMMNKMKILYVSNL